MKEQVAELSRRKLTEHQNPGATPFQFSQNGEQYKVQNVIFLGPDRTYAYNIKFDKPLDIFNPEGVWVGSVRINPVVSAGTVSNLLEKFEYNDLVLDSRWRQITSPDTATVQTIIRLESQQKRERHRQREEGKRRQGKDKRVFPRSLSNSIRSTLTQHVIFQLLLPSILNTNFFVIDFHVRFVQIMMMDDGNG
jgi:hypothetical protein